VSEQESNSDAAVATRAVRHSALFRSSPRKRGPST
jgi:hypothetical protein